MTVSTTDTADATTTDTTTAAASSPAPRMFSRKFLTTLAAQLTSIVVLLFPQHQAAIQQAGTSITALVVLALTTLGYVAAEASLDHKSAG